MANKKYIDENFDLDGLLKIGFIKDKTDYDAIEKRICLFFDLSNVTEYSFIGPDKPKIIKAENIFSDN